MAIRSDGRSELLVDGDVGVERVWRVVVAEPDDERREDREEGDDGEDDDSKDRDTVFAEAPPEQLTWRALQGRFCRGRRFVCFADDQGPTSADQRFSVEL